MSAGAEIENLGSFELKIGASLRRGLFVVSSSAKLPNKTSPNSRTELRQLSRQNAANWHICRKKVVVF